MTIFIKLGKTIDIIPFEIEEKIIQLFSMVQTVYYKHVNNMHNFLNYHYCIFKLLQLVSKPIKSIQMI